MLPKGGTCPLTMRPAVTTLNLQTGRLTTTDALEVRDSGPPCDPLPIDPTVCWAPKTPIRLWVNMPGSLDVDFSLCEGNTSCNPDIGGKMGAVALASLAWPSGGVPPVPPLPTPSAPGIDFGLPSNDVNFTPLSPDVKTCSGLKQEGEEAAPSDVYPAGQFGNEGDSGNFCCNWDLDKHRYHCSGSTEFKNCKKVNGQRVCQKDKNNEAISYSLTASLDYDLRGLFDFVTDTKHSFTELGCSAAMKAKIAEGKLDPSVCVFHCVENLNQDPADPIFSPDGTLCENGQLKMLGELVFPIPTLPSIDTIINGLLLVDHRPKAQDGDKVFVGSYGTLSFGKTSIEENAKLVQKALNINFPLRLKMAKVTAAILFDQADEPSRVVLAGTKGLEIDDYVDTNLIPQVVRDFFAGDQGTVKGCLYLKDDPAVGAKAGRLEGLTRFSVAQFPVDLKFTLDPPGYSNGSFDMTKGGFKGQGLVTLPHPFAGQALVVTGAMGFDGKFDFSGALDTGLALPGYPAFSVKGPTAQIQLSNTGVRVSGELPIGPQTTGPTACLTSLGVLTASGSIQRSGAFDMAVSGSLSPLCIPMSQVTGSMSSSSGLSVTGNVAFPFAPGGAVNGQVSGTITSPTSWRFETETGLAFPFGPTKLADSKVVITPSGASLSGKLQVPGFGSINVTGSAQANGNFLLTGALNPSVAGITLGSGTVTFKRVGTAVSIDAKANVSVASMNLGTANFAIATDGSFTATGTASFIGKQFGGAKISRTAAGAVAASGSVSVNITIASGSISIGYSGGPYANFTGTVYAFGGSKSVTIGVDGNGCFTVAGIPYPCPTWTNPLRFCSAPVGVCL
ncbi:MAG: hypothetical protein ACI9OJ_001665 [Myxococcota bacterium]